MSVHVQNRYIENENSPPRVDVIQNIISFTLTISGDYIILVFQRLLITGDIFDYEFSENDENSCYIVIAVGGGYHTDTTISLSTNIQYSESKVCLPTLCNSKYQRL